VQLGVYIHFPFCLRRCGYCDFASCASEAAAIPHTRYADAVLRELDARATAFAAHELRSVYFGGGTPSLWAPAEVARVLAAVRASLGAAAELEVTLEANPGTLAAGACAVLREAGVNRMSLGVQSLDEAALRLLGRIHSAKQARAAVAQARREGGVRLSCDLIFGLPGQSLAHHLGQLDELCALGPEHVSAYALSLAADAPLRERSRAAGLAPAPEELVAEMMVAGRERLARAGFPQYEVSSYAPRPARSRHNALVWAGHPYLGLGASAHSMLPLGRANLRSANPPLARYLDAPIVLPEADGDAAQATVVGSSVELVAEPSSRFEQMFLALRTVDGVDRAAYAARFGADPLAHFRDPLEELAAQELVTLDADRIAPTARGILYADELALRLLA
jgi:oxygen-independent coproporphyrinogen-3 oxidase